MPSIWRHQWIATLPENPVPALLGRKNTVQLCCEICWPQHAIITPCHTFIKYVDESFTQNSNDPVWSTKCTFHRNPLTQFYLLGQQRLVPTHNSRSPRLPDCFQNWISKVILPICSLILKAFLPQGQCLAYPTSIRQQI